MPFPLACQGTTLPVYLPLTVPDGPKPYNLLFQLCHHAKQIIHLLIPHTSGILTAFPRQQQAGTSPANGNMETWTATFLGRASVWVDKAFLGQALCLVVTMVNHPGAQQATARLVCVVFAWGAPWAKASLHSS